LRYGGFTVRGPGSAWLRMRRRAAAHRTGWWLHLDNLKSYAEGHAGLRGPT
jgi:hypothetical protein